MSKSAIFDAWAPTGGSWSPWVKPVLFAHVERDDVVTRIEAPAWIADALALEEEGVVHHRTSARNRDIAIVVDRDARESVAAGLGLLDHGYFPVPLFNALPHEAAVIPLQPVIDALVFGARRRREVELPNGAPPAFLLDARRRGGSIPIREGTYDNRSVMFDTDFPSPRHLMHTGLRRVLLVQERERIAPDLEDMIAAWQAAGLTIYVQHDGAPRPVRVKRPSWLARMARRIYVNMLHRHDDGSFGALILRGASGG